MKQKGNKRIENNRKEKNELRKIEIYPFGQSIT